MPPAAGSPADPAESVAWSRLPRLPPLLEGDCGRGASLPVRGVRLKTPPLPSGPHVLGTAPGTRASGSAL